jgi:hypothetical protein
MDQEKRAEVIALWNDMTKGKDLSRTAPEVRKRHTSHSRSGSTTIIDSTIVVCGQEPGESLQDMVARLLARRPKRKTG